MTTAQPNWRPLTTRQRAVFEFIASEIGSKKVAPSLQEIGKRFGFTSLGTVYKHVSNLERKGYIVRRFGTSRSTELRRRLNECPCCGQAWPK